MLISHYSFIPFETEYNPNNNSKQLMLGSKFPCHTAITQQEQSQVKAKADSEPTASSFTPFA